MKKISFFGDILVDLVKNGAGFVPQVGGSIFNTAISVGRQGLDVSYITSLGDDYWGRFIGDYCEANRIDTTHFHITDQIKTSLAFAVIDEKGDASYDFYKYSDEHYFDPQALAGSFLFHFGSTFSLKQCNHDNILNFLSYCRSNNIITSYDPNFRRGVSNPQLIKTFFDKVDIVKLSDEDADYIYGTTDQNSYISDILDRGVKLVVLTCGSKGARAFTRTHRGEAECVKPSKPIVNTIGAGDNFTAGMIGYLAGIDGLELSSLDEAALSALCRQGNAAALEHLTRAARSE